MERELTMKGFEEGLIVFLASKDISFEKFCDLYYRCMNMEISPWDENLLNL